VLKTVGLAEPLRDALKPVASDIRAAFVYGSVAKATDRAASDIDLMIISDSLTYGDVFDVLERVTRGEEQRGRILPPGDTAERGTTRGTPGARFSLIRAPESARCRGYAGVA